MGYDRLELVSLVQGHLPYFQNYMHKGASMASKKRKQEVFASKLDMLSCFHYVLRCMPALHPGSIRRASSRK